MSTLLYSLGKESEQVFKTFHFDSDEDEEVYETVLGKLDSYFVPKVNVIHERARFHQCNQKPGESSEEYIRHLHELSDTCSFGAAKQENIRDRLVVGILNKELSEKLQLTSDLTLDKAVEMVRQSEQVKEHISEQGAGSTGAELSEVSRAKQQRARQSEARGRGETRRSEGAQRWERGRNRSDDVTQQGEKAGGECYRCGRRHGRGDRCPARNAECRACKRIGHFSVVCNSRIVSVTTSWSIIGSNASY